jgi:hypothetical protein
MWSNDMWYEEIAKCFIQSTEVETMTYQMDTDTYVLNPNWWHTLAEEWKEQFIQHEMKHYWVKHLRLEEYE